MDTKLLRYYEQELQHLREMGGEFAKAFPKIAGRLGLETHACADPYVERLLESFSFLAARIQLKLDAEFPRITNHLLELVYPHYLAPTPSMAIVELHPDYTEGSLAAGFQVPRGTPLRSLLAKGQQTSCEYRTAHAVTLFPLELVEAKYFAYAGELNGIDASAFGPVKAGLRLRLRATAGLTIQEIALERLPLFLQGSASLPGRILEQLLSNALGMLMMPTRAPAHWHQMIPRGHIRALGFDDEEALLPTGPRSFQGYRLLQEHFAFPQRNLFVELGGLKTAVQRCADKEVDLVVLFNRLEPSLEQSLSLENIRLFCTPAINLFPKRADRIHLSDREAEYHLIPDRTRPTDFEVYQVSSVKGYGVGAEAEQQFNAFYAANDLQSRDEARGYYQVRRASRLLSERERRDGPRSSYIGSEVFLALVDASEAPYRSSLRQLGIEILCTNRDLPLGMPLGSAKTDFTLDSSAPVQSVRCLVGPSMPQPSRAEGETAWRLISHLSLNYLSLVDNDQADGTAALKDLLRLYCPEDDSVIERQIEGISAISATPVVRRLPVSGPISYARGLQISITFDDSAFEGTGAFLLGAVLERFFAKYVSLNAFTETRINTLKRGEIMKWPVRMGRCEIL